MTGSTAVEVALGFGSIYPHGCVLQEDTPPAGHTCTSWRTRPLQDTPAPPGGHAPCRIHLPLLEDTPPAGHTSTSCRTHLHLLQDTPPAGHTSTSCRTRLLNSRQRLPKDIHLLSPRPTTSSPYYNDMNVKKASLKREEEEQVKRQREEEEQVKRQREEEEQMKRQREEEEQMKRQREEEEQMKQQQVNFRRRKRSRCTLGVGRAAGALQEEEEQQVHFRRRKSSRCTSGGGRGAGALQEEEEEQVHFRGVSLHTESSSEEANRPNRNFQCACLSNVSVIIRSFDRSRDRRSLRTCSVKPDMAPLVPASLRPEAR
ncbi:hypothetical protein EYF80_056281 [Liparis tanakae]|uniref:Uncharacterized protein n=1 Tax=Liparis tanakae TaxID=230148 RepID=A0A4Z2EX73_9TELE|nr:hypothetical protein EYF80_056281 [Liparis tanakae]